MTIEQLKRTHIPTILFYTDELGRSDFVVCYGFNEKRFIIGEPAFGLMQYTSEEVEEMWIKGIVLIVSPKDIFSYHNLRC